ncbi:MAG: glycosyltransferase family 2 protein [Cyanobacteria bacterium J069]|nr:MAG: glycosyltransferase [Cyanobacteria bacterium J069]
MLFLNLLLLSLAGLLLIPVLVVFGECALALLPLPTARRLRERREHPRTAVLMPAHNESIGIGAAIATILPQLQAGDRLLVVADNCTDNTAEVAYSAGAEVIERHNSDLRGKGYALDFGLQHLAQNPPEVVVMADADCWMDAGALSEIARLSIATRRPVQSVYLMEPPPRHSPASAVSSLAFLVKNQVRLLGLSRLGMPSLLTGTGMAFPWEVICQSPLASGNIVEDMQLGLDLAIAGHPPLFCPTAHVVGLLPARQTSADSQRTRWEHGHLHTLITQVPRLLQEGIRQGRIDLLAIALDLAVPPLSLLVMVWGLLLGLSAIAVWLGAAVFPAALLVAQGCLLLGAISGAWVRFGMDLIPARALLSIPLYILHKIPRYLAFPSRRQTEWIRTDRESEARS